MFVGVKCFIALLLRQKMKIVSSRSLVVCRMIFGTQHASTAVWQCQCRRVGVASKLNVTACLSLRNSAHSMRLIFQSIFMKFVWQCGFIHGLNRPPEHMQVYSLRMNGNYLTFNFRVNG